MDAGNSRTPFSPSTSRPEDDQSRIYGQRFSGYNVPESPTSNFLRYAADQTLESAFHSLNLSPDSRRVTPRGYDLPASLDDVLTLDSQAYLAEFTSRQPNAGELMAWAPPQEEKNFGFNGIHGFGGAHGNLNVGPYGLGMMGFPGAPYSDAGDTLRLMMNNQRRDLVDNGLSFLQCKKPTSRKTNSIFPLMNRVNHNLGNNYIPNPDSYYNPQLYQLQQQFSLGQMRGRIVTFAKDQFWSGVLMYKLAEGLNEPEIEMILSEVLACLGDLIRDQFGSHFVLELFRVCNMEQRNRILVNLTRIPFQFINICLNSFGARAMVKLLAKLSTPQQISLVISALSLEPVELAKDPNGQLVLQYSLTRFPNEYNEHLLNEIAENCFAIATSKHGCCTLKSCLQNSFGQPRERLFAEIIANSMQLAEDPYGNYVVQYVLELRIQEVTTKLLRRFQGHFVALSCNKYASNVVEKFITESGEKISTKVIMELLASPSASMLLVDPFGNYVINKALSTSKGPVYHDLLDLVRANAPSMRSNLYGRKILAMLDKTKLQHV